MEKKFKSPFSFWTLLKAKVVFWFWWNFRATEEQKCKWDMMFYGTGIMKHGKRIDPMKFTPPHSS